jgi:hypothetical protein
LERCLVRLLEVNRLRIAPAAAELVLEILRVMANESFVGNEFFLGLANTYGYR